MNISVAYSMHGRVIEDDAHVALIAACRADDALVRRFGTLGIINLAIQPENHSDLIKHSAITALVDLVSMDLGDDVQCQRFACLALGNFAVKVENHGIILSSDALQPLIKCLQAEDLETRFYAAYCLGKIAQASHHPVELAMLVL